MGTSEGGMIAARYNNPTLDAHLSGRLISSWSCEYNYFVSCEESAKICADGCNKDVPVVSVVSSVDPYFGPQSESVSYKVAALTHTAFSLSQCSHCHCALTPTALSLTLCSLIHTVLSLSLCSLALTVLLLSQCALSDCSVQGGGDHRAVPRSWPCNWQLL